MVNLKEVYSKTRGRDSFILFAVVFAIGFYSYLTVFYSPLVAFTLLTAGIFALVAFVRPVWAICFLSFYLPFEPFLLKFVPENIYIYARFFSESLIYILALKFILDFATGKEDWKKTPIDKPFALFVLTLVVSTFLNFVPPTIAVLGARQILRFMLVFFIAFNFIKDYGLVKKITLAMFAVVVLQSALGISQAIFGGALDSFLLPSDARAFGDIQLTSGTVQFWDPGTRVFATLGRYDRLGTFLSFFMLLAVGLLYSRAVAGKEKILTWAVLILGAPALALTFSRSSWFGFLLGFAFIALAIKKDKKVFAGFLVCAILAVGYLIFSGLEVSKLIEAPGQSIVERFFEAFSYTRWKGEYDGLGRLYWVVKTFTDVIPAAPLFGFGPGQFGAGAVSALGNRAVYDALGLPFGVYGTEGYIDNNWLSIWGETGTLGFAAFIGIFVTLFRRAKSGVVSRAPDFARGLALGFMGAMISVAVNAFLATFLEVRTLAFYLWLYAGIICALPYIVKKYDHTSSE